MSISPSDLRAMLRADALALVLGALLMLAGLAFVALTAVLRKRAVPLLWLGAFSLLYGLRLLIGTDTVRASFDLPTVLWERTDAVMTYAVPIPIVFFARAVFPAWQRFWTIGGAALTAFAIYAIASDVIRERPFSAATPNNLIAISFFVGVVGAAFWPRQTPSRELYALRVGILAVALGAVTDNLRGIGVLSFRVPELEPLGFTVLIVCLGTITVWRVVGEGQRLVAINRELDIARQIQSSILPQTMPKVAGVTIAARYRPMSAVAGDFYDFVEVDDERLGILVADVSGHGVPAALIASMVKVAFSAQRDHAAHPAAVLAGMNETLYGRLGGQYVTAAYLFIDMHARVFRYGAAGHPPMLRSGRNQHTVDEVEENGVVLGFVAPLEYRQSEQPLRAGDRFVLYTDGVTEAFNAADDLFGLARLKATISSAAALEADAVVQETVTAVDSWSGRPPGDDLTLVLVDCPGARHC